MDADRPLERVLGDHLSAEITARAATHGLRLLRATGFATMTWNHADGTATAAAYGLRKPVTALRALAATSSPERLSRHRDGDRATQPSP
ncbi:hypothetical protein [Streptomyces griseorubiginosus]|uniref:hypothetical protein n=1 Tax=Streptomyces griseorubiginosus TaxID=67304 RepID=UPI00215A9084|nr:hypothetical protein [Streptomyces griseorubiginosus]